MLLAYKISTYNRRRKWDFFLTELKPTKESKILDVGFSENEWNEADNFIEKYYPYPENITVLGIETPQKFLERYPKVKAVKYDGKKFPFSDKEFDICWSNAVIEHVGDKERQLLFLKEIKRVAKTAFITTPNRYFPIEVHTRIPLLHYLPKKYFDKFLYLIGKERFAGDYMLLLSLKDIKKLLFRAGIKNYKIIKNRFFLFTLTFIIILGRGQDI